MRLIDVEPLECVVSITPKGVDAKSYNDGFTDALELMDKQPTIEAVPLDKLCEWLAEEAVFYADDNDSEPEVWKYMIEKCVMEEEHEDQT